jgi:hypothetical protein
MKCNYPSCNKKSPDDKLWVPVISIPTIRTVGMIEPVLSPLVHNGQLMQKMELDLNMTIRNYQLAVADYRQHCNDMVETSDPTIYLGREVCDLHKALYRFMDWFGRKDWERMVEAARTKGVMLDTKDISLTWEDEGFEPAKRFIEVVRD